MEVTSGDSELRFYVSGQRYAYKTPPPPTPIWPGIIPICILGVLAPSMDYHAPCRPPKQAFGIAHTSLSCNVLSRNCDPLPIRILGIPVIRYFGDFGIVGAPLVNDKALNRFGGLFASPYSYACGRERAKWANALIICARCGMSPARHSTGNNHISPGS